MGYMKEKVAYLKGLAEGMNIGGEGQGKLLNAMISHHGRNGRRYSTRTKLPWPR